LRKAAYRAPAKIRRDVVERDALGAAHDHSDLHVILQILPYPRRIQHDIQSVLSQELRRAHPGELQQLRRVIRPAGNQDFLSRPRRSQRTRLAVLDGDGTTSIEHDALRQCGGLDVQVLSAFGRTLIRHRRARSSSSPRRGLEEPGAFLRCAVEVRIDRQAGLGRGSDEG
jgi:hypothetical protein